MPRARAHRPVFTHAFRETIDDGIFREVRPPEHRVGGGRFRRSVFALVGLRPAASEHTAAEGRLLREYAAGRKVIVEIGVAEGGSAWEMRQVMAPDGKLYLIDPYPLRNFGPLSPARLVAHRLVASVTRAEVVWIEEFSHAAAKDWTTPIDFLFIDGDHSVAAVTADWSAWTCHLAPGGHVALHDARIEAAWTDEATGPVRLLTQLRRDTAWRVVGEIDSLVVLQRAY